MVRWEILQNDLVAFKKNPTEKSLANCGELGENSDKFGEFRKNSPNSGELREFPPDSGEIGKKCTRPGWVKTNSPYFGGFKLNSFILGVI